MSNAEVGRHTITQDGSAKVPILTGGTLGNGASYLPGGLVAGSWGTVKGSSLSTVARIWQDSDFVGIGNKLPTILSGVQVLVNNVSAAVYFIAPGQINFQMPAGIVGSASVQVLVNGQSSNSVTAATASSSPVIFPVILQGVNYPAAVFSDVRIAGDPALGSAFRNAKPDEVLQIFATALAPVPAGVLPVQESITGVTVTIGNITVPADFAGLVAVGEFQINVKAPQQFATMAAGLNPITIAVNGVSSPPTINSSPPAAIMIPIGQ